MSDKLRSRERYGEASWRVHHEVWRHSELQQEYCDAYGVRRSAIGERRAEPQPLARKVLYRRGGLSHALSHGLRAGWGRIESEGFPK
jgi:hypothetical protein